MIDIITHKSRAVRTWNAPAVIALSDRRDAGAPGELWVADRYGYANPSAGTLYEATLMRPDAASIR